MNKNSVLMFDFDGVIVDSFEIDVREFIDACQEMGLYDINSPEDVLELFDGNVYEMLLEKGLSKSGIDDLIKLHEIKMEPHLKDLELFDGMKECLTTLSKNNIIYIITSNSSKTVEGTLRKYEINFIEEILGVENEKSKVKKISNIIEKFPKHPSYYIGDTIGDIIEGKKAGAKTIGVTWGWHGKEKLISADPDYIVEEPFALISLLQEN